MLVFDVKDGRNRLGLKGPRAAEWLVSHDIVLPVSPNSWTHSTAVADENALLVARLGHTEFFLEDAEAGAAIEELRRELAANPPAVYPVLREDWAFELSGDAVHDVLAQVCNVHFVDIDLDSHPVIMTLMIGVAVLVLPRGSGAGRRYRIWCDPTFGPSLSETLAVVVAECGGTRIGVSA